MRRRDRKSGRTRRQYRPRLWQDIRPAHAARRDDFLYFDVCDRIRFVRSINSSSAACPSSAIWRPVALYRESLIEHANSACAMPSSYVCKTSRERNGQFAVQAQRLAVVVPSQLQALASRSHHPMFATSFEQSRIDCAGIRLRRDRCVYNHALHAQGVDHAGALGRVACLGRNSPRAASPSRCATALGSTD